MIRPSSYFVIRLAYLLTIVMQLALILPSQTAAGKVTVDNTIGNHALEGVILNDSPTMVKIAVKNLHNFWTNLVVEPSSSSIHLTPTNPLNGGDDIGGIYAALGVLGPNEQAVWDVTFDTAQSDSVTISVTPSFETGSPVAFSLNELTFGMALLHAIPTASSAPTIIKAVDIALKSVDFAAAAQALQKEDVFSFAQHFYSMLSDANQRIYLQQAMELLGVQVSAEALKSLGQVITIVQLAQMAEDVIMAIVQGTGAGQTTFNIASTTAVTPATTATPTNTTAGAADWPMAGATLENTSWNMGEKTLAPPLTQSWHWQHEQYIVDGITVANGVVYVAGEAVSGAGTAAEKQQNQVFALDAVSGKELWNFTLQKGIGAMGNDVVVGDGRVYFGGQQDSLLYALDAATGQRQWVLDGMGSFGLYSQNAKFDGGVVFVQTSNNEKGLSAVEAQSGKLIWSVPGHAQAQIALTTDVAIRGGDCLHENNMLAVNRHTGDPIWNWSGTYAGGTVVVGDNVVFTTLIGDKCLTYQSASAFNVSNGKQIWRHDFDHIIGYAPLAYAYSTLYVGAVAGYNERTQGILSALNPANGEVVAQFDTEQSGVVDIAVANNVVYIASLGGPIYGLTTTSLQPVMKLDIPGTSLAVAENRLFVGTTGQGVYSFVNAVPATSQPPSILIGGTWTLDMSNGSQCDVIPPKELMFLADGTYKGDTKTVLPGGNYAESKNPLKLKMTTSTGDSLFSYNVFWPVKTSIGLQDWMTIQYSADCAFKYIRPHR